MGALLIFQSMSAKKATKSVRQEVVTRDLVGVFFWNLDFLCIGKKRKGSKNDNHVELVPCDPSKDSWDYSPHSGLLKHEQSAKCLKVTRTPLKLWLKECNSRDTEQKWFWSNFDDEGLFLGE